MKRIRHVIVGSLLAVIIAGSLMVACKPDATPEAKNAEKWLIEFYQKHQIRGYWGVFGVEAKDDNVLVPINIPNQQAEDLKKFDEEKRKHFIAFNACPPVTEPVWWSILSPKGDVIIQARERGEVFATVPCKENNKGNPL